MIFVVCVILNGSCSTGISIKQKNTLMQHAAKIATAINATVKLVQKPLYDFRHSHGYWPVNGHDQQLFVQEMSDQLRPYYVDSLQLASVDQREVIVEFFLSHINRPKLPRLIESWVVVFSIVQDDRLEIISIYPIWSMPDELAKSSSFNSSQIGNLQKELKKNLHEQLNNYSIKLNENFSQLAG